MFLSQVGLPGKHANRNDKFWEAMGDIVDSSEKTIVFHSNQRISMAALLHPLAEKNLPPDIFAKLLATPFLHGHLFHALFRPTVALYVVSMNIVQQGNETRAR